MLDVCWMCVGCMLDVCWMCVGCAPRHQGAIEATRQAGQPRYSQPARPATQQPASLHSSDGLVAHELAHQWFGDYLTTRNWANVWLNEGFATYLDLLWTEHETPEARRMTRLPKRDGHAPEATR